DQLGAHGHRLAVLDEQAGPLAHRVGVLLTVAVGGQDDAPTLVGLLDLDPAVGLGDRGDTLRGAGLEELDDARQTLGDVVTGHTTGVEGAHRQLGAGLTDRLRGDDADGLADVDQLTGREAAAVALGAGADLGLAGEHRAHLDLVDTGLVQPLDRDVTEVRAGLGQHRAVVLHVSGEGARVRGELDVVVEAAGTGEVVALGDRHGQSALVPAFVLAADDVL